MEGQELRWCDAVTLASLETPPADVPLIRPFQDLLRAVQEGKRLGQAGPADAVSFGTGIAWKESLGKGTEGERKGGRREVGDGERKGERERGGRERRTWNKRGRKEEGEGSIDGERKRERSERSRENSARGRKRVPSKRVANQVVGVRSGARDLTRARGSGDGGIDGETDAFRAGGKENGGGGVVTRGLLGGKKGRRSGDGEVAAKDIDEAVRGVRGGRRGGRSGSGGEWGADKDVPATEGSLARRAGASAGRKGVARVERKGGASAGRKGVAKVERRDAKVER